MPSAPFCLLNCPFFLSVKIVKFAKEGLEIPSKIRQTLFCLGIRFLNAIHTDKNNSIFRIVISRHKIPIRKICIARAPKQTVQSFFKTLETIFHSVFLLQKIQFGRNFLHFAQSPNIYRLFLNHFTFSSSILSTE